MSTIKIFTLQTKVNDLPLRKFRKVSLINSICRSVEKGCSNLFLEDLSKLNIVDGKIFNNKNEQLENIGKVRTREIEPFILLSKILKKEESANEH